MPVRRIVEGLDNFERWWDIYPLLLFPLRTYDRGEHSGFLNPRGRNLAPGYDPKAARPESRTPWGIWVDLAAYGVPRQVREGGTFDAKKTVREFEHWTRSVGGFQAYYTGKLGCCRGQQHIIATTGILLTPPCNVVGRPVLHA